MVVQHWQPFWNARNARERRMLAGLALFLAVVVGYAGIWQPAVTSAQHNRRLVAKLGQQVAALDALANEAAALKRQPALPVPPPAALLDLLKQSATAAGLSGEWRSDNGNAVSFSGTVPFDAWLRWAGGLMPAQQVRLVELQAESAGQSGSARVTARFAYAGASL
jgi:general secretion pathway protein M